MAAYPDRDTLRLRAPDRRTPAQAVELARRELAPRPASRDLAPTLADVGLSRAERRVLSFRERYPGVAERFHGALLWAAAHGLGQLGRRPTRPPCAWDLARAWGKRHGGPALRVDQLGRLLLGDPCPACQAALGWHPPKPKPRPRARSRSTAARSSTSTRATRPARTSTRHRPAPAELVAATTAGLTAAAAAYNRQAAARLGLDPAKVAHLTRPRP